MAGLRLRASTVSSLLAPHPRYLNKLCLMAGLPQTMFALECYVQQAQAALGWTCTVPKHFTPVSPLSTWKGLERGGTASILQALTKQLSLELLFCPGQTPFWPPAAPQPWEPAPPVPLWGCPGLLLPSDLWAHPALPSAQCQLLTEPLAQAPPLLSALALPSAQPQLPVCHGTSC